MVLTYLSGLPTLILMFERFTNRARHVVVLAQEEARRLQHNYIGTEHVLLGLLGEPDGPAYRALEGVGMSLEAARDQVTAIVGTGASSVSGHIPFTPRAKKTLELSLREALQLHHNYIGTEHILLGLIREGEGVAAQVLKQHADLTAIRAAVLDVLPAASAEAARARRWLRRPAAAVPGEAGGAGEQTVLNATPAGDTILGEAARLAGSQPVGSHHLLLAALGDPDTAAARALAALGVDLDQAKATLRSADITGTSDEPPEEAGPPPDGHPGDRRPAHHRGNRPSDHRGRPGRTPRAGRPGQPARHDPRRPARLRQPQRRLAGPPRQPPLHSAARSAARRFPGHPREAQRATDRDRLRSTPNVGRKPPPIKPRPGGAGPQRNSACHEILRVTHV